MGTLQSCAIFTSYLSFLHLGTFTALQRELPYLVGKGEVDKARKLAGVCQGWVVFVGLMSSGVFLVLALVSLFRSEYALAAGWLVQSFSVFFILYTGYLGVTYRTTSEFAVFTKSNVKVSLSSILTLPLLGLSAYYGMCLRNIIIAATQGVLLHYYRPIKVSLFFDWSILKSLIAFGFPLSVFGYVETSFWLATQNYLVSRTLGTEVLGLLAFTLLAQNSILIIPQSINQVYMPRISQHLGSSADLRGIVRLCIKPTIVSFLLSCVFVLVAWFSVGPACRLLAPKYIEAVPAIRLSLLIMPLVSLRLPQYILIAARKRRAYAACSVTGLFVGIALLAMVLRSGFGLSAIILAYLGGYFAMIIMSLFQVKFAIVQNSSTDSA
jgi:O-antigen/teichoic acid export membrane protein